MCRCKWFVISSTHRKRPANDGAPVELDKKLGGVIGAIRERGEFAGHTTETLLIIPPPNSIKAKALLLIGLGDEESLSLKVLEQVGKTAIREAARLGISRVALRR